MFSTIFEDLPHFFKTIPSLIDIFGDYSRDSSFLKILSDLAKTLLDSSTRIEDQLVLIKSFQNLLRTLPYMF